MGVYIIAEAGVNHNGDIELAKKLIDAAKEVGADCIKFQTFKTDALTSKNAKKAEYQVKNTKNNDSQYDMLKKLELSYDEFVTLKTYSDNKGIDFLSTPFDLDSIDFLYDLGVKFWKIPSGEVNDLPYLEKIAETHLPVVLSTGMCNMQDVKDAINVFKGKGISDLTLLHCTTEYPTPLTDVNLLALKTMKNEFGLKVGYSDHTAGILVSPMAVALGAEIIEKHFTLDKTMEGPDHKASLNPLEFKAMVENIRQVEQVLGDGIKEPNEVERKNLLVVRKSIVASRDIKEGEIFTIDNITIKRPGTGISPMRWYDVLGTKAIKNYNKDDFIEL